MSHSVHICYLRRANISLVRKLNKARGLPSVQLFKEPRILYVDNDSTSAGFVKAWLTRNAPGCKIVYAASGREGLDLIAARGFDLYLFEYCLGEMTGPELCRQVRLSDPDAKIVICTSLERDVDRQMALAAGAAEYLVKPEEFYRLSTTLRQHLGPLPRFRNRLFHGMRRSAAII
ncbi:MAG: response regulator [Pyrinomonadaceae bacterium]